MDSQSTLINGWNSIYIFGSTTTKTIGQLLPIAEFAHNLWRNETTKMTPYQTLMGYNPVANWRPTNATIPASIMCLEQWMLTRKVAYAQMKQAQE